MKTREDVSISFDHHRPITEVKPEDAFLDLQQRCPVAWSDTYGGFWILTRYRDVAAVYRDHKRFSTADGVGIPRLPGPRVVPSDMDRPEHTPYRKALTPSLTRSEVESLRPRIEYWTTHFIDQVIERGECDLVHDLASPIPCAVTLEWIGWSRSGWSRRTSGVESARPGTRSSVTRPATRGCSTLLEEHEWFNRRIVEQVADRRAKPRDDLMTHLALLEINGERISDENVLPLVRTAIGGGVDTVTSLIAAALWHLHHHPSSVASCASGRSCGRPPRMSTCAATHRPSSTCAPRSRTSSSTAS